ncbi:hypothetical protein KM043_015255 [Ampulex compressa]|nr:hypothetical protein KM043_015255 [Ampulex compressa]
MNYFEHPRVNHELVYSGRFGISRTKAENWSDEKKFVKWNLKKLAGRSKSERSVEEEANVIDRGASSVLAE